MKRSLRRQIFLWYAISIPILIIGMVLVTHQVMTASLADSVDERLQERSETVAKVIIASPEIRNEGYENLIELFTEEYFAYIPAIFRISDPSGNQLAIFGDVPDPLIPLMDQQLALTETSAGRFATIDIRGHEALRIYTTPVIDPYTHETIVVIQTGDSLAQVVTAEQQLWRYALVVGIAGILAALLVGRYILQRGFRPLDGILDQIQEIESKNLFVRLPDEPRPLEIQHLADNLNSMLYRLDTAFRAREQFVATISHDLRTPLTAIQGQIEVLLMQKQIEPELRDSLERMAKEVRRLIRMSNNLLLDVQLQSRPTLVSEKVNLKDLLEEVEREVQVLASGLELKVIANKDVFISGDYDLLKQMLLNVVENAIKFTHSGGTVKVALTKRNGYATIKVSDNGIGISKENLSRIMEPYYKTRTPEKSKSPGTGLGLSIVKQIVVLHAGSIEIDSQEGKGTTVQIQIPVKNQP
ncbi:MAG: ATP-binding protein [Dehalococcoidales bacterium]|nr:ATP-binding protein [Dehalococcoidales bacterium]